MLSVVIPAYCEQEMVPVAAAQITALLLQEKIPHELIFVDDGIDCEGQFAAELLLRRREDALLCSRSQLSEIIRTENEDIGAGAD